MKLDEIRPLHVLSFDETYDCLCGCRTVLLDLNDDSEENELYVVCENNDRHPLTDLCDEDGEFAYGIEFSSVQPDYLEGWNPESPELQVRLMKELQPFVDQSFGYKSGMLKKYLDEALFNMTMLRYCLPQNEADSVIDEVAEASFMLSTFEKLH